MTTQCLLKNIEGLHAFCCMHALHAVHRTRKSPLSALSRDEPLLYQPVLILAMLPILVCGTGSNMWTSKQEMDIVTSSLRPKLEKTRKAHESLLDEAITLQVAPLCSCCTAAGL